MAVHSTQRQPYFSTVNKCSIHHSDAKLYAFSFKIVPILDTCKKCFLSGHIEFVLNFDAILPKIDFICLALHKKTHSINTIYRQNNEAGDNF
jgi:hypothetical protein